VLLDLVDAVAGDEPDRPLLVTAEQSLSYADIAIRARAVAGGLSAAGIDRFGVACTTPVDAIVALLAASAVGAEPCVYPRCDLANSELLASEFEHSTVLVSEPGSGLKAARTVASLEQPGTEPSVAQEDPVLILTSGTTGRPKGTRHRWSRLLAAAHPDRGGGNRRWLLAYNLNQYAGLQVLLHVIGTGDTLVIPESPQPRPALSAIQAHGVTHISATPTFWRFLLHLLSREPIGGVPALQQITIGGEAVSDELLDGLRRRFPAAQVSQVYASSEFGSSVSVTDGRAGLPLSVLDRPAEAPVHFRIVDGELQARSTVGMQGYHGSDDRAGGWHSTGDLVEVDGDRIRFVAGNTEVLYVGGVIVYRLTIVSDVAEVPRVVAAAVFGHPNPVTGSIVAVDVVGADGIDEDGLKASIRSATASLPPAQRPRRIRVVNELNVANSKVRRTGDGGFE
jgi:acyl-CoA synthetase (AMP-forming)/AMP-acid ligase II